MTDEEPKGEQDPSDLQFDRAEPQQPDGAPGGLSCEACTRPITDVYFTAADKKLCAPCRDGLKDLLSAGTPAGRFFRALFLGTLAMFFGAAVWYGIRALTGYDIGLVAIFVGYLVGVAVRRGSGGLGGRGYQFLAMLLTYLGISISMIPDVITAIRDLPAEEETAAPAEEGGDPADTPEEIPDDAVGVVIILFMAILFLFAMPVLAGISSPIYLIIMAFALWEAWRRNTFIPVEFAGPFKVSAGDSPEGTAGA